MPSKPVILIVDNAIDITGALNAILGSADYLKPRYRFIFVLPNHSKAAALIAQHGHVVHFLPFVEIRKNMVTLAKYLPSLVSNSYKLKKIAFQENAALLHMNDFYNQTGVGACLFGFRGPMVTHVRFMPKRFGLLGPVWSFLNRTFSDRVVCVSEAVRAFFPAKNPDVRVIHDPLPVVERYATVERDFHKPILKLLYVANFISGKGQNYALEAFRMAYAQNPNLRLSFMGGDMGLEKNKAYKQELISNTRKYGLSAVVSFATFSEDVEMETKKADIALNFSESEAFSLTCLEALYFGTPLIASDSGGPGELFENGNSGLLVANRDVPAMANAILKLAASPELRQQFSVEGRKYVSRKFSIQNTSAKLGELYKAVLKENGA